MVWKGLTAPVLVLLLVYWPVTNGTFWPITILASSLSKVSKFGVESTLPSPVVCKNRAKKPSTYVPLLLCATPKFRPEDGATVPLAPCAAKAIKLAPPTLKLVPSKPMLVSPLLPIGPCHCTPNSAAFSALTSAIKLSTKTCARRASSLSMTARSCRYCGSGAVMINALVEGSA